MAGFARWLVRHPAAVVAANVLVTAILGLYALQIRIENSLESLLPAGDPEVAYYERTRTIFRSDDLFAPTTIAKIARVTEAIGKIPGVERVLSLTNAVDPAADVVTPPR